MTSTAMTSGGGYQCVPSEVIQSAPCLLSPFAMSDVPGDSFRQAGGGHLAAQIILFSTKDRKAGYAFDWPRGRRQSSQGG